MIEVKAATQASRLIANGGQAETGHIMLRASLKSKPFTLTARHRKHLKEQIDQNQH